MSVEDYKKISFGFRPDNRFFIFRDAATKKTGFSFRIPFGQAAIHPIQLIHLLLSPVRILFLLIAPVGQKSHDFPASAGSTCFGTTFRLLAGVYTMTARHEIISRQFFFSEESFPSISSANFFNSLLSSSSGRPLPNWRMIECSATAATEAITLKTA